MSDIAALSFTIDTSPLAKGGDALDSFAQRANAAQAALDRLGAISASAMSKVASSMDGGASGSLSAHIADQDRLTTSIARTSTALSVQTGALHASTAAHGAHGTAARNSGLALMEVEHIGRSLFDVFASGGSVLRGLAMESGRLQIAFQNGLGGALGTVAERALGFINPLTLGIGTVAGLGAAALLATSRIRELDLEMNRATGGAGRFAGLSGAGLSSFAAGRASDFNVQQSGMSIGDTRTAAMDMARTGRLSVSSMTSVMDLVPGYAGLTGGSMADSSKKLAGIFADPTRGMSEMEKAVGALSDRDVEAVRSLQARGDAEGAVRRLVDATSTSLNEMVKPQGSWDRFSTWWSNRNAAVEGMITSAVAPTPAQQYRSASMMGGSPGMLGVMQSRGLYDDGTGNLAEDFRHRAMLGGGSPIMRSESDTLLVNQRSQSAGDIIRSVLPDVDARQKLVDRQSSLSQSLATPGVLDALGPGANDAREALDRLNTGIATFKTGLQKLVEQGDFATRSALARTAVEKAAVDADKAYAESLERTLNPLAAAQAATNQWSEAIASSTRNALDALRATTDRAALVGLSPYDRMMTESRQRYRDLNERTISGVTSTGPVAAGPVATGAPIMTGGAVGSGFSSALSRTLGFEGGMNPHDTNGTPSNMGINAAANPGVDVASLTPAGAGAIYKKNYWDAIGADSMSPQMARVAFDTAVMQGVGQAMKEVTASGGDASRLMDLRENFEGSLLHKNPGKYGPYTKAWADRDAGLRADISGGSISAGSSGADTGPALLANRLNYAVGRQAGASDMLMRGPTQAGLQLDAQSRMAAAQREAFGQSASSIAAATEKQKEWNEVTAIGVTQQKLQNDFGTAGVKMWDDLSAKISANAELAGRAAQDEEDAQNRQKFMSSMSSGAADVMSAGTIGALTGKGFVKPAESALFGLGQSLIHSGFSSLFSGLLGGKGGGGGGGLFGGLVSSLFHMGGDSGASLTPLGSAGIGRNAEGTNDWRGGLSLVGEKGPELVNMPAHAQVIPNSALGAMRGGGGHTFNIRTGDVNVDGDVSDKNMAMIQQSMAQTKADVIDHITRTLPHIEADSRRAN